MPSPRSLLRLVYLWRFSVAIAIYLSAAFRVQVTAPLNILVTSILLVATLIFTGASYWHTHVRDQPARRTFLYLQAVFDVALVTAVVHVTGGPESDFQSLYVPVIAVTAVLMPPGGTALITVLAGLAYLADLLFGHSLPVSGTVWIQLGLFALVAAVPAYFASRIKVMTAEHEALAGELRQARLEASDVLHNLVSGVLTVDADGKLLFSNPAAEQILGFRAREWLGRTFLPELARLSPEFWAAVAATARRGIRLMRVEATVRRGERSFPVGLTTTTISGSGGLPPRVTAIFTDISDSKRLEELHLRAERLEAVAELSASLAHEIKNPLASIRSSVEQLARSTRTNPDEKFLAGLIVRESDRLSRLLSEFLDFSRVRVTEYHTVDLRSVATAAVRVVRQHPDCPAEALIEIAGGPTPMEGDEDLLHRVVSNLVLNAVQAKGPGVHVALYAGRLAPEDVPAGITIENPVTLRVSDNGPGIPDTVRERLFEPFVTGRPGGTGLGLAIVQRAVVAHRGMVLVDSIAGQGTTFTVFFPAARRKEEAA
ncbi:MAG TPA: ATP-binding protein [Gemmatimonadales bacterium]|nr:ATP-binding protein [Gemmatimonadales bacterium]